MNRNSKFRIVLSLLIITLLLTSTSCSFMNKSSDKLSIGALSEICNTDNSVISERNNETNNEDYGKIIERGFISPVNQALSTFSSDVDTAAYSNIRRMIKENQTVDKDAVRIEEMINYFNYDYPEPEDGLPVSISTELYGCPWNNKHNLLQIGICAVSVDKSKIPASNLVFLLDVSGSMYEANKLPLVQRSFALLIEQLREDDIISLVVYAGDDEVILEGVHGNEKSKIMAAVNELTADGSTQGSKGIQTAYSLAEKYFIDGGNNRVILATDGDFNVGITSQSKLEELIKEKRNSGVFLSVLGFGMGNIKDNIMETLADNGNGNYAYIDSLNEARKVFVEEMGGTLLTVAKDVKIQVEFNPSMVKGYRLIGYENRMLNDEDFKDDNRDAGDMGSGHTVTAIYEIIPSTSDETIPDVDELKYQQAINNSSKEWMTVKLRYKDPNKNESKEITAVVNEDALTTPSDNSILASAVAEWALCLRNSAYRGNASKNHILESLLPLTGNDLSGYIKELYELVKLSSF